MAQITQEQKDAYGENYSHVDVDETVMPKLMTEDSQQGDLSSTRKNKVDEMLRPRKKLKFSKRK